MKKSLVVMMVALMGVFMIGCSGGGVDKAKDIVKEIKEKGKDMNVDQLKDKLMDFAKAVKPVFAKVTDALKEVEKDPSKAAGLASELEGLEKEITPLMEELEKVTKDLPAYKEIENDEAFQKEFLEAMGKPEV